MALGLDERCARKSGKEDEEKRFYAPNKLTVYAGGFQIKKCIDGL